ncbi:MAG TPA: hypothetical protein VMU51_12275 [Mycobacteriales bacterium]|nr:hypothetical protein [Mycobacteriales bacterium]
MEAWKLVWCGVAAALPLSIALGSPPPKQPPDPGVAVAGRLAPIIINCPPAATGSRC